ncbi:MAG: glutathione S-transferase [Hyphomicrobiales bacterium]
MTLNASNIPILYSFRRCPYAIRGRLAIASAGFEVELREVVLRDKPDSMLAASPKGTVPVLILPDETVVDESLDVMLHVLNQHDPEHLLTPTSGSLEDMLALITESDGPFKSALDRYKYANRYEDVDTNEQRKTASAFLSKLDKRLAANDGFLFGKRLSLADLAILPFVRQFANVDRTWFDAQEWPALRSALETFITSDRFLAIMDKYPQWHPGDTATRFAA